MTNPNALRTGKTAATSDNGLNGAQRLNGALAVERFELTKKDSAERAGAGGSGHKIAGSMELRAASQKKHMERTNEKTNVG